MSNPISAYETLKNELDKTAVISDEFKNYIIAYTQEIAKESYTRGAASGYAQALLEAQLELHTPERQGI